MRQFYNDEGPIDTLLQIAKAPVRDGDLVSKIARTEFVRLGWAYHCNGWNVILPAGEMTVHALKLTRDPHNLSGPTGATGPSGYAECGHTSDPRPPSGGIAATPSDGVDFYKTIADAVRPPAGFEATPVYEPPKPSGAHYVNYTINKERFQTGPYGTWTIAEGQRLDIKSYAGVSDCWVGGYNPNRRRPGECVEASARVATTFWRSRAAFVEGQLSRANATILTLEQRVRAAEEQLGRSRWGRFLDHINWKNQPDERDTTRFDR